MPSAAFDDVNQPNPARVYDFWLGGKDNYRPDRATGAQIAEAAPWIIPTARANRAFVHRVVLDLARRGIEQFIDLGCGLPRRRNVHDLAQRIRPATRVVYVDHDVTVLAHARALLARDPGVTVLAADARDPRTITDAPETWQTLDRSKPVAVLATGLLETLTDDEASALVNTLRDAAAPGSYLALTQLACDGADHVGAGIAARIYRRDVGPAHSRSSSRLAGLLPGYRVLPPGIVPAAEWGRRRQPRPDPLPVLAALGQTPS